jgi:hypothetical protein
MDFITGIVFDLLKFIKIMFRNKDSGISFEGWKTKIRAAVFQTTSGVFRRGISYHTAAAMPL